MSLAPKTTSKSIEACVLHKETFELKRNREEDIFDGAAIKQYSIVFHVPPRG